MVLDIIVNNNDDILVPHITEILQAGAVHTILKNIKNEGMRIKNEEDDLMK